MRLEALHLHIFSSQQECRFYSKLVRLEGVEKNSGRNMGQTFLFQIGAIRRTQNSHPDPTYDSFYSKLVRLEVICTFNRYRVIRSFYSKLVRLEGVQTQPLFVIREFLFQIGAIRRLSKNSIYSITNLYSYCQVKFQSEHPLLSTSNRANLLGG